MPLFRGQAIRLVDALYGVREGGLVGDVAFDEVEGVDAFDVFAPAGGEVVDAAGAVTLLEDGAHEVAAKRRR